MPVAGHAAADAFKVKIFPIILPWHNLVPMDLGSTWKRKRSNIIAFRNAFGDGYILEVVEQHLGVPSSTFGGGNAKVAEQGQT